MNAPVEQLPCDIDELRTLFLFESLTGDQLEWLCAHGHIELHPPGYLFREGDPAKWLYLLLDGEIATYRRVGADDVEVTRTSKRGVYSGAWAAYLGERAPRSYPNTMRAVTPARFYVLSAEHFAQLMREWFPMAVHLLDGLFFGVRSTAEAIGQRERLLALGSLSAGLTHELNNPAGAAVRATSSLRERVSGMRRKLKVIAAGAYDRNTLETLITLQEDAVDLVAKAPTLAPIEAADREDELSEWFSAHGLGDGWDLAPTFVQAGIELAWLDQVAGTVEPSTLDGAIRWLTYTLETELLMNEIDDATTRISTLVGATRQYSQLDRGPFQTVDIHDLLNSTLVMLSGKIGDGITVIKDYDRTLPEVAVYAAELNQVWTNLIVNALQAMAGTGTLTIRTSRADEQVQVEIADTGPGIPEEVQSRIFEPFFTTKPFGEGTGLGLDISWRIVANKHHGSISVQSVPGDTRFRVRIPVTPEDATVTPEDAAVTPEDEADTSGRPHD